MSEPVTLLVASGGGHLTQLAQLLPRLTPLTMSRVFVTYPGRQAGELLADVPWVEAYHPTTRNLKNAALNLVLAQALFSRLSVVQVVSTGAGIAVPFAVQAAVRDIPFTYIESATRRDAPSLSGRMVSLLPRVDLLVQHQKHSFPGRWNYRGGVYDGRGVRRDPAGARPARVFCSLGTHHSYTFDSLVRRVSSIAEEKALTVEWQLGCTRVAGLKGPVAADCTPGQMERSILSADVVIAHAGTGIIETCTRLGRVPVVVPRRAARGEHVDDHQVETAQAISEAGLVIYREVDDLDWTALVEAARCRVDALPVGPISIRQPRRWVPE